MRSKLVNIFLSIILLLYPIFTVINCFYNENIYFSITKINLSEINKLFITSEYTYDFWKVFFSVLFVLEIIIFTILPIISLIKPNKKVYIFEFILITADFFCMIGLPKNYLILFLNILFHILTLFIIGTRIKSSNEF